MADLTEANKLTSASARGDLSEVETLLQSGADVNKANRFGRTALQVMKLGVPGLAEMLLEAKADPNKRDPVKDLTIAHDAARDGYLDTLRVLVKYGADVNAVDSDGNLPLHLAAQAGCLDVVEFLKQCTADQGSTADDLVPTHSKECIQGRMQSQN
ncbi:cyclin-dependent kinase 4 inhibitor C [Brienomyrus brachyistius]|uniref:cyclin-dependent kinase 4 inhibitor C n=1 Tax=Brienomyrus brachyistius TaxID=42636 RepID=UPI0020B17EAB|nr:cyclin-dependent kinase 4 inhibitor C [Brienomyrus brachyistius]